MKMKTSLSLGMLALSLCDTAHAFDQTRHIYNDSNTAWTIDYNDSVETKGTPTFWLGDDRNRSFCSNINPGKDWGPCILPAHGEVAVEYKSHGHWGADIYGHVHIIDYKGINNPSYYEWDRIGRGIWIEGDGGRSVHYNDPVNGDITISRDSW